MSIGLLEPRRGTESWATKITKITKVSHGGQDGPPHADPDYDLRRTQPWGYTTDAVSDILLSFVNRHGSRNLAIKGEDGS
jgi:hypothetical protein